MNKNTPTQYISIEDSAELVGYSVKYLRKLIKTKVVDSYKVGNKTMISWESVKLLATSQKPFWVSLSDKDLKSDAPNPALLIHTETAEKKVYYKEEYFDNKVVSGNCLDWIQRMPDQIIQSVVTSPPYWGVRKYPGELQITWSDGSHVSLGEEPTVEGYVSHTLEILRNLKRVLKDDGTIWWNLGDIYQTRAYLRESSTERLKAFQGERNDLWKDYPHKRYSSGHPYLKDKDLTLMPFLVAIGAERLGYYVRSIIVWNKDNTLPEPTVDRPTTAHEYIILLAKSRFYKYDKTRETEDSITGEVIDRNNGNGNKTTNKRTLRTVWQFPTSSQHGNHTAAFPMALPLRCLRLSTTPGDLVFDPFAGSGTTLAAAKLLGCNYFGCDIIEDFVKESERRLKAPNQPLHSKKPKDNSRKPAQLQMMEKSPKYKSKSQKTEKS